MLITEKDLCTGCGVCSNVCHVNAMKMVLSEKGFLYPEVDDALCVNYKQCTKRTRNNGQGISCAIVNSRKGNIVFDVIRRRLTAIEKTMEEAIRGNRSLVRPWPANEKASKPWNSYIYNKNDALLEFCKPYKIPMKMILD